MSSFTTCLRAIHRRGKPLYPLAAARLRSPRRRGGGPEPQFDLDLRQRLDAARHIIDPNWFQRANALMLGYELLI